MAPELNRYVSLKALQGAALRLRCFLGCEHSYPYASLSAVAKVLSINESGFKFD